MQSIKIKISGVGNPDGVWEIVSFTEFLTQYSPRLSVHAYICGQFPPLHILNEELLSGGRDQGMSGGAHWKPFEVSGKEYEEIKEELLTSPNINLNYDQGLEEKTNIKKWCGAVMTKYNPRKLGNANDI